MKYLVVVEKTETGYSAYSPDLPGCVSTGAGPEDTKENMREAIEFHIEGLRAEGEAVPEPSLMEREIRTHPLTAEQVRGELRYFVEYFRGIGKEDWEILFGYAWGTEYYPGNEWAYESIELVDLERKVSEVESSGTGVLSRDDLFVRTEGLEFRFCHESDLHISFDQSTADVENFYDRWASLDFHPTE